MQEAFISKKFRGVSMYVISEAINICQSFHAQGYDLTLRQIYYQFVGQDLFPDEWIKNGTKNHQGNYKKLGTLLSDARRVGILDWKYMVDRTRSDNSRIHWDSIEEMLTAYSKMFTVNYWEGQETVPEIWVEKDALIGIFDRARREYDVTSFSTRGYPSDSTLYQAAHRIRDRWRYHRQVTRILHFADHDPSGIDMTRSIEETLRLFKADSIQVDRIALNWSQTSGLPPNFAKPTDTRTDAYVDQFQTSDCWELDALHPQTIDNLAETEIKNTITDQIRFDERIKEEEDGQNKIRQVAKTL